MLKEKRRMLKPWQSSFELKTHPLDGCDSGVPILFEGTTKLKSLNLPRPRCNSEQAPPPSPPPDVELKIVERSPDPVGAKIKSTMDKLNQLFDSPQPLFPKSCSSPPLDTELFIKSQAPPNKTGLLT